MKTITLTQEQLAVLKAMLKQEVETNQELIKDLTKEKIECDDAKEYQVTLDELVELTK